MKLNYEVSILVWLYSRQYTFVCIVYGEVEFTREFSISYTQLSMLVTEAVDTSRNKMLLIIHKN